MEWTGFTDEQLRRLKAGPEQDSQAKTQLHRKQPGGYAQQGRTQSKRAQFIGRGRVPPLAQSHSHESGTIPLVQNQMLSRLKQVHQHQRPDQMQTADPGGGLLDLESGKPRSCDEHQEVKPAAGMPNDEMQREKDGGMVQKQSLVEREKVGVQTTDRITEDMENGKSPLGKELDEEEGLSRELSKLEEFQQRQKEIENENQRKKNLLAMVIADRKKKTRAEVKRLAYIQKELSEIEEFLTADVNILRDKIEEASRQYSEAQKRYQKAEAEFVAAKMHLHKTSDHKEALTEHLCTIIRENELRKAKKLEELTEKLDADNLAAFEAQLEVTKKAESPCHQLTRVESEDQTSSPPALSTDEPTLTSPHISSPGTESKNFRNLMQGSSSQENEPVIESPTQGLSASTSPTRDNGTIASLLPKSSSGVPQTLNIVENNTEGSTMADKDPGLETTNS